MTTKKKVSAEFKRWERMLEDSTVNMKAYLTADERKEEQINKVMKKWKLVRK